MIPKRHSKKRGIPLSKHILIHKLKTSRIVSGVFWSAGANVIIKVRGFLIVILISRFVGIEWFGAYSLIYALASYGSIIATLSLPNAAVRFLPEEPEGSNIFILLFVLISLFSLFVTLPILFFAEGFASLFLKDTAFSELVFWGAFLVVLHSLQLVMQDYYRAREKLKMFSLIQIIFPVVELLALSACLFAFQDVVLGLKLYLLLAAILDVILILDIFKQSNLQGVLHHQNFTKLKSYLRYSLPLVPTSFTSLLASNGDRFLIGLFLGAESVGYYGAVYALASVVMLFNSPITNALFPRVSKLYVDGNIKAIGFYVRAGMASFFAIGTILFLLYVILGNLLLSIMLDQKEFLVDGGMGELLWVLFIVKVGLILYGAFRIFSLHLFVLNETVSLFWIYFSTAVVNFLLLFLLVPGWGLVGAAIATLLAYGFSGLLIWLRVRASYQRMYIEVRPYDWTQKSA